MLDHLEIHLLKWNAYAMLLPMEVIVSSPTHIITLFKTILQLKCFHQSVTSHRLHGPTHNQHQVCDIRSDIMRPRRLHPQQHQPQQLHQSQTHMVLQHQIKIHAFHASQM